MDYLPLAVAMSATAGGFIIGLLSGLGGIKKLNQTLNAKQYELDGWKQEAIRASDLVAKYEAKQPERDTNGKFTSKKARVTAELQAYVASKKETAA